MRITMELKQIVTGPLDENCYLLLHDDVCLVVDPGDEYVKIKEAIGNKKVLGVLITHAHFDHIGALRNFLTKKSIKIFKKSNVEDEKSYTIGPFTFQTLYTPGHSSDSVSYYFPSQNKMFTGDFVFRGTVGRVDLPTGNENEMQASIEKLKRYQEEITLYPGHGDITTLSYEKEHNVYF